MVLAQRLACRSVLWAQEWLASAAVGSGVARSGAVDSRAAGSDAVSSGVAGSGAVGSGAAGSVAVSSGAAGSGAVGSGVAGSGAVGSGAVMISLLVLMGKSLLESRPKPAYVRDHQKWPLELELQEPKPPAFPNFRGRLPSGVCLWDLHAALEGTWSSTGVRWLYLLSQLGLGACLAVIIEGRTMTCSYPDWAGMCKHVAAVMRAFGGAFKARVRAMGIWGRPTSFRLPWQNGYAERLIGSVRRECTDHLIAFNAEHLRRILAKYANYYNEVRTHLSLLPHARLSGSKTLFRKYPILGCLHHRYARIAVFGSDMSERCLLRKEKVK